jgi:flagellar FliJ protein
MAKFKFKLETVLKVKIRVEDLRKRELRLAEIQRDQAHKQLLLRQAEVTQTLDNFREDLKRRIDVRQAVNYERFLRWLNKQVELAAAHLEQCQRQVAEARNKLIEAAKERQILEKLKEKEYEAYKREEQRLEDQFLDELGTGNFIRQGHGQGGS